ncbi:MAG: FAD-dependent oxidoreductase [Janthinobacterium lividum]
MSVAPADGVAFDAEIPVVIIGAGAAGLVAALIAHAAGAEVLVLERDALPRGSTALSAGLVPAAGTRWQRAAGIEDAPARFAADIMAKAHDEPDPALVHSLTARCGPVLEWLADTHGLPFSVIEDFTYPGHSARRMHGLPTRSGAELMDRLLDAATRAGIDILCDAQVTTLHTDGNHVRGIAYTRPDGSLERVACTALVLACNGYGGNRDLVAQHVPALSGALYFGHPGNQGEAVLWGEALGAQSRDLSGHQGHGSVAHPAGILITWATITEGGIQVNTAGRRFSNEMQGYSEQAAFVLQQPDAVAWTVFDSRIAGIARQFEDFRQAEAAGAILSADDPAALAALMRVPPEALAATLDAVEDLKQRDNPDRATDAFGRNFHGAPPLQPPLCAVRVTGALFHTQGGLAVNGEGAVLDPAGAPFPNLFAAGGAACGVSGREASGYLSGNGLLAAVALGALAGEAAAALVRPPPPR